MAITAIPFLNDYQRRKIEPDEVYKVSQGELRLWLVCGQYAAVLVCGDVQMYSPDLHPNTYSPQEIADLIREPKATQSIKKIVDSAASKVER